MGQQQQLSVRFPAISPSLARSVVMEAGRLRGGTGKQPLLETILGPVISSPLPAGGSSTATPSTPWERTQQDVAIYEAAVNDAIKSRHRIALWDILLSAAIIILLIAGLFWTDINGKLVTLGLSTTSAVAQGQSMVKTDREYQMGKLMLKDTVAEVKVEFNKCGQSDAQCLSGVSDDVAGRLKNLHDLAFPKES